MEDNKQETYSAEEAAKILGVSAQWLKRGLIPGGHIKAIQRAPGCKISVSAEEIERYLKDNQIDVS